MANLRNKESPKKMITLYTSFTKDLFKVFTLIIKTE